MGLARSAAGQWVAGFVMARMSFLLPVERLRESGAWIAFHHPRPVYPVHILLAPKRAIGSLMEPDAADGALLAEMVAMVQSLVRELGLEAAGYRLISNGGPNQEVAQLHFHLVSGAALGAAGEERESGD